jgi:hypothetical protein
VGQVIAGDSGARILHPEEELAVSGGPAHGHASAGLGELHGVVDEILEYLKESVSIGEDLSGVESDIEPKLE